MSVDTVDSDDYVSLVGYLFLPEQFADEDTYGYRWEAGDVVNVRVIARVPDGASPADCSTMCCGGNEQTEVTLASAVNMLNAAAGLFAFGLSAILF